MQNRKMNPLKTIHLESTQPLSLYYALNIIYNAFSLEVMTCKEPILKSPLKFKPSNMKRGYWSCSAGI